MAEPAPIDVEKARATLRSAAERVAALLESAPDPTAGVPGMDWTVSDLAVHLALGPEVYESFASGSTESPIDVSDVAGGSLAKSNAALLEAESERDLDVLVARYRKSMVAFLSKCQGRPNDETVLWNGETIPLGALLGLGTGEALVHGRDLASALGMAWPIAPDEAQLVLSSALPLLHILVDRSATADVVASYELRVRGGDAVTLRFDRGTLTVGPPGAPVDCHVSADPVALLLVSYGRSSHWAPALTGKMLVWGRKPWLGFRLTRYLANP